MKQKNCILILEDDRQLGISLKISLSSRFNQQIIWTDTLSKAYKLLDQGTVELVIADWLLAKNETSLPLIHYISEYFHQTKVLMLTCKSECNNRVLAYKKGVDAYLCKPFNLEELLLVVSRLLHSFKLSQSAPLSTGDFKIDQISGKVGNSFQEIQLRPKEMALLKELFLNRPNVLSKQRLVNAIWPNPDVQPSFNTVEVYIRRLRQLLHNMGIKIRNQRGYGYYFEFASGNEQ